MKKVIKIIIFGIIFISPLLIPVNGEPIKGNSFFIMFVKNDNKNYMVPAYIDKGLDLKLVDANKEEKLYKLKKEKEFHKIEIPFSKFSIYINNQKIKSTIDMKLIKDFSQDKFSIYSISGNTGDEANTDTFLTPLTYGATVKVNEFGQLSSDSWLENSPSRSNKFKKELKENEITIKKKAGTINQYLNQTKSNTNMFDPRRLDIYIPAYMFDSTLYSLPDDEPVLDSYIYIKDEDTIQKYDKSIDGEVVEKYLRLSDLIYINPLNGDDDSYEESDEKYTWKVKDDFCIEEFSGRVYVDCSDTTSAGGTGNLNGRHQRVEDVDLIKQGKMDKNDKLIQLNTLNEHSFPLKTEVVTGIIKNEGTLSYPIKVCDHGFGQNNYEKECIKSGISKYKIFDKINVKSKSVTRGYGILSKYIFQRTNLSFKEEKLIENGNKTDEIPSNDSTACPISNEGAETSDDACTFVIEVGDANLKSKKEKYKNRNTMYATDFVKNDIGLEPNVIETCRDLESIGKGKNYPGASHFEEWPSSGTYSLQKDLDCKETGIENSIFDDDLNLNGTDGFDSIQDFSGTFNGNEHIISNIYINKDSNNKIGLFGEIEETGSVENLYLENINYENTDVGSSQETGGISGLNKGKILNSYAKGNLTLESNYAGGLVGKNEGIISNSYTELKLHSKGDKVGGLVGENTAKGVVNNSYSVVDVKGAQIIGGLVGENKGEIKSTYSSGTLDAQKIAGGLVGKNSNGTIENSFSTVKIKVDNLEEVGGLVGISEESPSKIIKHSAATNIQTINGKPLFLESSVIGNFDYGEIKKYNDLINFQTYIDYFKWNSSEEEAVVKKDWTAPILKDIDKYCLPNVYNDVKNGTYVKNQPCIDIIKSTGTFEVGRKDYKINAQTLDIDLLLADVDVIEKEIGEQEIQIFDASEKMIYQEDIKFQIGDNNIKLNNNGFIPNKVDSGIFKQDSEYEIRLLNDGEMFEKVKIHMPKQIQYDGKLYSLIGDGVNVDTDVNDEIDSDISTPMTVDSSKINPLKQAYGIYELESIGYEDAGNPIDWSENDLTLAKYDHIIRPIDGSYLMSENIDATQSKTKNGKDKLGMFNGDGFRPIGKKINSNEAVPFIGEITGDIDQIPTEDLLKPDNSYIENLFIQDKDGEGIGLVSKINNASINNLGMINNNIVGKNKVGSFVGVADNHSNIFNVYNYTTNTLKGKGSTGGLVGSMSNSSIYSDGEFRGQIPGVTGLSKNQPKDNEPDRDGYKTFAIENIESFGNSIGGIVGSIKNSEIHNLYSKGNIQGQTYIGGIVGNATIYKDSEYIKIYNTYYNGNINAKNKVGGIVGSLSQEFEGNKNTTKENIMITNSYSKGNVFASDIFAAGIAGRVKGGAVLKNNYSIMNISGSKIGGITNTENDTHLEVIGNYYIGNMKLIDGVYVGGIVGATPFSQRVDSKSSLRVEDNYSSVNIDVHLDSSHSKYDLRSGTIIGERTGEDSADGVSIVKNNYYYKNSTQYINSDLVEEFPTDEFLNTISSSDISKPFEVGVEKTIDPVWWNNIMFLNGESEHWNIKPGDVNIVDDDYDMNDESIDNHKGTTDRGYYPTLKTINDKYESQKFEIPEQELVKMPLNINKETNYKIDAMKLDIILHMSGIEEILSKNALDVKVKIYENGKDLIEEGIEISKTPLEGGDENIIIENKGAIKQDTDYLIEILDGSDTPDIISKLKIHTPKQVTYKGKVYGMIGDEVNKDTDVLLGRTSEYKNPSNTLNKYGVYELESIGYEDSNLNIRPPYQDADGKTNNPTEAEANWGEKDLTIKKYDHVIRPIDGNYLVANNIDAKESLVNKSKDIEGGFGDDGFRPIGQIVGTKTVSGEMGAGNDSYYFLGEITGNVDEICNKNKCNDLSGNQVDMSNINNTYINSLFIDQKEVLNVGLISWASEGAKISDLGIIDSQVVGKESVGTFVGATRTFKIKTDDDIESGTPIDISNVYTLKSDETSEASVGGTRSIGGIVGNAIKANITSTGSFKGQIPGVKNVGKLDVDGYKTFTNINFNTSYVNGASGGIAGYQKASIINKVYSLSEIEASERTVGGIVGANYKSEIRNSYSEGKIEGEQTVGGIAGTNFGLIKNTYSTADIISNGIGERSDVGGIVGLNYNEIANSYSSGDVTGNNIGIGGIAGSSNDLNGGGRMESLVINCISTGKITNNAIGWVQEDETGTGARNTAGIVGDNSDNGDVINCLTFSDIENKAGISSHEGHTTTNAIVGANMEGAPITNSYAGRGQKINGKIVDDTLLVGDWEAVSTVHIVDYKTLNNIDWWKETLFKNDKGKNWNIEPGDAKTPEPDLDLTDESIDNNVGTVNRGYYPTIKEVSDTGTVTQQEVLNQKLIDLPEVEVNIIKEVHDENIHDGIDEMADAAEMLKYKIKVSNTGNRTLTNVTVTDLLEDIDIVASSLNSCSTTKGSIDCSSNKVVLNVDKLKIDEEIIVEFKVKTVNSFSNKEVIKNTATITSDEGDAKSAEASISINKKPEISIRKTVDDINKSYGVDGKADTSEQLIYKVEVKNIGNVTAEKIQIIDEIKDENLDTTTLRELISSQGKALYADPIITWDLGTLNAGEYATMEFKMTTKDKFTDSSNQITNTAKLTSSIQNEEASVELPMVTYHTAGNFKIDARGLDMYYRAHIKEPTKGQIINVKVDICTLGTTKPILTKTQEISSSTTNVFDIPNDNLDNSKQLKFDTDYDIIEYQNGKKTSTYSFHTPKGSGGSDGNIATEDDNIMIIGDGQNKDTDKDNVSSMDKVNPSLSGNKFGIYELESIGYENVTGNTKDWSSNDLTIAKYDRIIRPIDGKYELASNIDGKASSTKSDISDKDGGFGANGFNTIGKKVLTSDTDVVPFTGILDGNNKDINNIMIHETDGRVGLFATNNGYIKNVDLLNVDIKGTSYVGAIAGGNYGTIEATTTSDHIDVTGKIEGTSTGNYVGGIIGHLGNSGVLKNSVADVLVTGGDYVGGSIGIINGNSFANNVDQKGSKKVTGNQKVGGLFGQVSDSGKFNAACDSSGTGKVTGTRLVGGAVGLITSNFTDNIKFNINRDIEAVSGGIGGVIGKVEKPNSGIELYDSKYSGTIKVNNSSGAASTYIGGLIGQNGNNKAEIYGLGINKSQSSGTIDADQGSVISAVGGIAGWNDRSIDEATNNMRIYSKASLATGGIIGYNHNSQTIQKSINNGDINSNTMKYMNIGGIVGQNIGGSIQQNSNKGHIFGVKKVGGIVGLNTNGKIEDNNNEEMINDETINNKDTMESVGGIVGENDKGEVRNSNNKGSIYGRKLVGGIVGYDHGNGYGKITISHCDNNGFINGEDQLQIGGIAGYSSASKIEYSNNRGKVSGQASYQVGGIVGKGNELSLKNSSNYGKIEATKGSVGGIMGELYGHSTIYGKSSSKASDYVKNGGEISGSGAYVGGIVGKVYNNIDSTADDKISKVRYAYNYGKVDSTSYTPSLNYDKARMTEVELVNLYEKEQKNGLKEGEGGITRTNYSATGGIIGGFNSTDKSNSKLDVGPVYNHGEIVGNRGVGGIVGYTSGKGQLTIRLSKNKGKIRTTRTGLKDSVAGGIVGVSVMSDGSSDYNLKIYSSYNIGWIISKGETAGGIMGASNGSAPFWIRDVYNIGTVETYYDNNGGFLLDPAYGGIVGFNYYKGNKYKDYIERTYSGRNIYGHDNSADGSTAAGVINGYDLNYTKKATNNFYYDKVRNCEDKDGDASKLTCSKTHQLSEWAGTELPAAKLPIKKTLSEIKSTSFWNMVFHEDDKWQYSSSIYPKLKDWDGNLLPEQDDKNIHTSINNFNSNKTNGGLKLKIKDLFNHV